MAWSCGLLLVRDRSYGSPQAKDNRSLKDQIEDFLSLRLTVIVIDDYILTPLRTEIERLKPPSEKVMARSSARIVSPRQTTTARSTAFSSSRTLPGQG